MDKLDIIDFLKSKAFGKVTLTNPRCSCALYCLTLLTLSALVSCTTQPTAPLNIANPMASFCAGDTRAIALSKDDKRRLHSICTAWYPGSAVPEFPQNASACATILDTTASEQEFLSDALGITPDGGAEALCFYATLDRDNDNILDYQITDAGRFVENDIDVDNDGVPNVRDTDPIDPLINTSVSCGNAPLPAHLDSACLTGTGTACDLQTKLYNEFDIVVINRDFKASPELIEKNLQSVYDSANLVFRDGFQNHPAHRQEGCTGVWTMQTVAFEQCVVGRQSPWDTSDHSCLLEEHQTTEASAMAHNGLFTVYPAGADLPAVIQLGTYVHELGHLWQFAYDVKGQEDTSDLVKDNLWLVPEFEQELAQWDWVFPKISKAELQQQRDRYRHTLPREDELIEHREADVKFQGYTLDQHRQAAEYEGLLTSDESRRLGNFGIYSLSNAWEWHADLFIAYLYRSLEEHIANYTESVEVAGEFTTWFRAHVLDRYNNQFYHPNLKQEIYNKLRDNLLPISDLALDELLCRYLINDEFIYGELTKPSFLPFSPKVPPDHVREEIQQEWAETCTAYTT